MIHDELNKKRLKGIVSRLSRALEYKTLPKYCRIEISSAKFFAQCVLRDMKLPDVRSEKNDRG